MYIWKFSRATDLLFLRTTFLESGRTRLDASLSLEKKDRSANECARKERVTRDFSQKLIRCFRLKVDISSRTIGGR